MCSPRRGARRFGCSSPSRSGLARCRTVPKVGCSLSTTHSRWLELLRDRHPEVVVVDDLRVVDEGAIVTAGGITAGIDLGLHLVARLFGEELAAEVASVLEYPSPKTPASASTRSRSGK